jgi:hypothetical protein
MKSLLEACKKENIIPLYLINQVIISKVALQKFALMLEVNQDNFCF